MKIIFLFALAILVSSITGCATAYQPSGLSGGFRELNIKDDVWRVSFGGNGYTTRETAQTFWLYRCAELTLKNGYDGFEILSQIQLVMEVSPEQFFNTESKIIPTRGGGAPIFIPMYIDQSHKPLVQADIRMLKKPFEISPPKVFDATQLKTALEPYMVGKECETKSSSGNVCPHVHEYLFPKGKFDKIGI